MRDPIEELGNFDPGVPVSPLPAAEVRARGDRLRKRNTALVVAGAALAVALIVTPIAVFANRDGGGRPAPAEPGLTESVLLTADEVPARERLSDWKVADQPGETLACAPEPISSLDPDSSVRRDFAAEVAGSPVEGPPSSAVRTEVLQFDDTGSARTAYDTALGWISDCPLEESENLSSSEGAVDIKGGGGEWRARSHTAPEYCGGSDCDSMVFDRMGVAQFGDRLVLVSLAEVGGPLEPEGLNPSMHDLFQAAVTKAGGEVTGASGSGPATRGPEPNDGVLLDPHGLEDLRLGMTPGAIEATGQATSTQGSRHDGWAPGCEVLDFTPGRYDEPDPSDINGRVSPEQGLEQIRATPDMVTPEGIRIGSTREEVRLAYPGVRIGNAVNVVTIPASDTSVYRVMLGSGLAGTVQSIDLELLEQDCGI